MTPTHPVSGACPDSGPEALAAWLRLTLIPGIGGETQRKLLTAFGLPDWMSRGTVEWQRRLASLDIDPGADDLARRADAVLSTL